MDASATPLILVTNDDGIDAPGLQALSDALAGIGEVVVVAPDRERSGAGHALTLGRPLRVRERGPFRFAVDGTPTDCIHLGVFNLAQRRVPDLVVSGINRGLNLGDDVTYSGTVAAALEGTLLHIPSLAFSAATDERGASDFRVTARFARRLADLVLREGLPPGVLLNVNVPLGEPTEVRVTRQGTRIYRPAVVERLDPSGRPYYWIGGADTIPSGEAEGDHAAVRAGAISLTPLHANMTAVDSLETFRSWRLSAR